MIHTERDIEEGQLVWLFPHTKQASRNVHRMLQVRVKKDPKAHWPRVLVVWTEKGETAERWELVHKDNIRLRAPGAGTGKEQKHQGDGAASHDAPAKVRIVTGFKPVPEIDPEDGIQEALF